MRAPIALLIVTLSATMLTATRGQRLDAMQQMPTYQQPPPPAQQPQSSFFDRASVMPGFLVRYRLHRRRQLEQELEQLAAAVRFAPDQRTRYALEKRYLIAIRKLYPQYTDQMRANAGAAAFYPRAAVPAEPLRQFRTN